MIAPTQCKVIHLIFIAIVVGRKIGEALADDAKISDYIRRCCISGLRHARTSNSCENIDSEVASIPPLWLGLCHSTFEVCCSRELEHQSCELGRLAALEGTRCNKFVGSNSTLTSNAYADCCRACQVGLAVKASQQNCKDPLFSFLSAIESYRVCCDDAERYFPNSESRHKHEDNIVVDDDDTDNSDNDDEAEEDLEIEKKPPVDRTQNNEDTSDGTIVLTGDNDDICGEIKNLCAHICENTVEAYKCKCHPGFQLDENNVTCSPVPEKKNICPTGYGLDGVQGKCVDIDECKEQLHECKLTQYCHNTIGGYHCLNVKTNECLPGYHYGENSEECEDDDECNRSPSPCDIGQVCINHPGGYKCIPTPSPTPSPDTADSSECGSGFYLKEDGSCVDIDECAKNTTNNCHIYLNKECRNTLGSFVCQCQAGYRLDATQDLCVDINECSINNHNCLATQRCDNTIGSYFCTRLQSCGTGYTLNAETGICDDDDECALGTHNCQQNYDCYNTKGSFRCHRKTTTSTTTTTTTTTTTVRPVIVETSPYLRNPNGANQLENKRPDYTPTYLTSRQHPPPCTTGFYRNYLGACVDINECIENRPCGSHERCINTNGHYRCVSLMRCPGGFKSTPDGTSCVDINECETGEHNCGDTQICNNRNGGYICACPTGHQISRSSGGKDTCVDINECTQDQRVCPSTANCFNTIGSYYCECKSGFEKKTSNNDAASGDSIAQCFDVDECKVITGLCQQKCVNFWGGYRCSCHLGYQLGQDNRTCNDINECEVHKDYNLCMGSCINTAGSYECSCPRGYTLASDKMTCRDIDECEGETQNHVCTGRHDICTNIRGSYKCTTINCPYGYINDPEQKKCRQTSNYCDGEDCYTKPSAYTYNFITFVSKLKIPPDGRTIFTLRGPEWYNNIDFDLKIVRIQASPHIERASESHFDTIKSNNQVNLLLKRALDGPQDIELELSMTVFTNGMPRGKSIAKLFLFVSQYTF